MSVSATIPQPEQTVPHALRERNFRRWWIGAIISLFGDQFYLVALPWLVLQLTGSSIALGTLLTAAALPRAVFMLVGGALSDAMSPRKVMIVTASVRATLVAAIAGLMWMKALHLWELYVLSFAFGTADAFAFPAIQTFLPSLVKPQQLAQANSAAQGAYQLSTIAGPVPAAFAVRWFGAAWAFLLDGLSFLAIIVALWGLPDPPRAKTQASKPNMLKAIGEGFQYVWRDSAMRSLVLLMAFLNLGMYGPMLVGLAYLSKVRFQSPTAYGVWLSALAAGSLVGTLLAGFPRRYRRGPVVLLVGGSFGTCSILLVWLNGLWAPSLDLFLMGVMSGFVNVQITAWIQQRSDRSMLGRVSGVQMLSAFGLSPISLAIAGVLAQWNLTMLFVLGGLLMITVAGVTALSRSVYQID